MSKTQAVKVAHPETVKAAHAAAASTSAPNATASSTIGGMIDIRAVLIDRFPALAADRFYHRWLFALLKGLCRENAINAFIESHRHLRGMAFLDAILRHFDFSYSVSNRDRENIPVAGPVVIVANHPLGSLDGLALLKLIHEVRPDVRVLANELLYYVEPLQSLFVPVDNMRGKARHTGAYRACVDVLEKGEALIMFPAGTVSRIRPNGVRDGAWNTGFLHFVKKARCPVLPVHVKARNSWLFYALSLVFKPLGMLVLVHEMFKKQGQTLRFRIGAMIAHDTLAFHTRRKKDIARDVRRHVYRLAKANDKRGARKPLVFATEAAIAHPTEKRRVHEELKAQTPLGITPDGKRIYLLQGKDCPSVMHEIGRLRELTFRTVGEGTGKHLDLDAFDECFQQLVLWDKEDWEIVGAYRLGLGSALAGGRNARALYSAKLFEFAPDFAEIAANGVELGRSFVQPRYWGKRSLEYLWVGIGAFLVKHATCRYLYGPVSLSNDYPEAAKQLILGFYATQFGDIKPGLATPHMPYPLTDATRALAEDAFTGGYDAAYANLNKRLRALGVKMPTLYKQYAELCEPGGFAVLGFNVDADFGDCVDALIVVDMEKVKPAKRARYVEVHTPIC